MSTSSSTPPGPAGDDPAAAAAKRKAARPRAPRRASFEAEIRQPEAPAATPRVSRSKATPRAPAAKTSRHQPRTVKPGGGHRKTVSEWPAFTDDETDIPPDKRDEACAELDKLMRSHPAGWDMPVRPDTMLPDGKGGSISLQDRAGFMIRAGLGPEVAAEACEIPRELFYHWARIGSLARALFGYTRSLKTPAGVYVSWTLYLMRNRAEAEARLLFKWSKAADDDWRAAASLARYVNPQRFAPELGAGTSGRALPTGDVAGDDAATSAAGDGPVRLFIPAEDDLRAMSAGSEERPIVEGHGVAVEETDLDDTE